MDETNRIQSLEDLFEAVQAKRAVVCPKVSAFTGPIPAAFIINLPGAQLLRLLRSGLYLYEKSPDAK